MVVGWWVGVRGGSGVCIGGGDCEVAFFFFFFGGCFGGCVVVGWWVAELIFLVVAGERKE